MALNRRQFSQTFTNTNRRFEAVFYPRVVRALRAQVNAMLVVLRSEGADAAIRWLNQPRANEALTAAIRQLYLTVGMRHARMNYSRLLAERVQEKRFGASEAWQAFINNYLEQFLTEKITWTVSETLRNMMLTVIQQGITDGDSVDQIVARFTNWPRPEYQAARIVRTETNRAANVGARAQAATDQYQQVKEWISAEDNRVRGLPKDHADHRRLDGVTLDENDFFRDPRNGDYLSQPGDPKASAASTVNCRCSVAYTYKRDGNGNLIPKRRSTVVIYPGQIRTGQTVLI